MVLVAVPPPPLLQHSQLGKPLAEEEEILCIPRPGADDETGKLGREVDDDLRRSARGNRSLQGEGENRPILPVPVVGLDEGPLRFRQAVDGHSSHIHPPGVVGSNEERCGLYPTRGLPEESGIIVSESVHIEVEEELADRRVRGVLPEDGLFSGDPVGLRGEGDTEGVVHHLLVGAKGQREEKEE